MPNYTNYAYRAKVLDMDASNGILYHCNLARRVNYCQTFNLPLPEDYNPNYFARTSLRYQIFYPDEWAECEKILNADRERTRRLRHRLEYLIANYNAHFVTFDFSDKFLSSTSSAYRRKYIQRFLNSLDTPYVGNIDFGDLNGREHYHAVIGCRVPKHALYEYVARGNGSLYILKVTKSHASGYRLSKYVTKLCNHAVKATCKRNSLMYSRKHVLPSSAAEVAKLGSMPLPGTENIPQNTPSKPVKYTVKQSFKKRVFTARCAQCGAVIADLIDNEPSYVLTRQNYKGKTITQYFCKDCIEKYKIKIGG